MRLEPTYPPDFDTDELFDWPEDFEDTVWNRMPPMKEPG